MKILYISAMSSPMVIDKLHAKSGRNPGFAMQKFNRLVAQGLSKNGADVATLSAVPALRTEVPLFYHRADETINDVKYRYIPFVNLPVLRQLSMSLYVFFYVLLWGLKDRREKCVVFDVLNISVCIGGLFASKINRVKTCGIMTDMPGLMVGKSGKQNIRSKIVATINKLYLKSFNRYVFLTEAMNIVNAHHKPYIVMEGLVDCEEFNSKNQGATLHRKRALLYAGGLYEKYGIKMLIDAFQRLDNNITLHLYGSGDMVHEIKERALDDERIKFHGVAPNSELVEIEKQVLLLVNPRPTHEEFVKYSFPSKNMEYMVSGSVLLTTRLPGMPKDYYPYVYLFEDETTEGYYKTLNTILSMPESELCEFGKKSRQFVLENKNNVKQAKRILQLLA